jgi:hypothetical protein
MPASWDYSAKVALTLVVDGVELALSHVGPSGLVVRDACEPRPECQAKLRIAVGDSTRTRSVYLPHGIPGAGEPFAFL